MKLGYLLLAGFAAGILPQGRVQSQPEVVSRGARFELKSILKPEGTTVLLFTQDTSSMEQQFLAGLEKELVSHKRAWLRVIRLKDTNAPAALQYEIKVTPTAIVFDRFGNTLGRTSQAEEIRSTVRKGELLGRIKWIDEDDPKAPDVYGAPAEQLKRGLPGIVKTMSLRKDVFGMFNMMSQIHFSDGFLKRRDHEMVAAYVSGLNKCRF